jgi:hypothetical protein
LNIKASTQEQNKPEVSRVDKEKKENKLQVNTGDQKKCPECSTMGRVVWISQDKKTMGVQCSSSHREAEKPQSRYGSKSVPSTKTKKNVVFLMAVE